MPGIEHQVSRLSLGTKISLITSAQYRYEGTVAVINSIEGTLTLQNVRFWGTENRMPGNGAIQNSDNSKAPMVGAVFDSITFWMSSVIQIWSSNDPKMEKNELGDKAVVKAAVSTENGRGRGRRQRNWWYAAGDQQRSMRMSPTTTPGPVGGVSMPMGRYAANPTQHMASQPRMLVSYPRRGRTMGMMPRPQNYVPFVPIGPPPGGPRRSGYMAGLRGPPYRLVTTPIPAGAGSGMRGTGRKPGQSFRRIGNPDGRRFIPGGLNPRGVYVYLPPEMAPAYHSRSMNMVPARSTLGRRRLVERRGTPRGSASVEPEIDCTTPYDFESANAELEAELAKINLNADDPTSDQNQNPVAGEPRTQVSTDQAASTGDGLGCNLQISSTTTTATNSGLLPSAVTSGSGASGDSSTGNVSSTIPNNVTEMATNVTQGTGEGSGPLAKGEYYVREKCFFDQISRSEGGPRGPVSNAGNRSNYAYNGMNGMNSSGVAMGMGGGPMGASSVAAARRERQLNLETFGPMAARTTFISRRRPTGSVPRDLLVSASA